MGERARALRGGSERRGAVSVGPPALRRGGAVARCWPSALHLAERCWLIARQDPPGLFAQKSLPAGRPPAYTGAHSYSSPAGL